MTDKYPLLTVENVKYWYWECDPAYSSGDIAKATGAKQDTVLDFMKIDKKKSQQFSHLIATLQQSGAIKINDLTEGSKFQS